MAWAHGAWQHYPLWVEGSSLVPMPHTPTAHTTPHTPPHAYTPHTPRTTHTKPAWPLVLLAVALACITVLTVSLAQHTHHTPTHTATPTTHTVSGTDTTHVTRNVNDNTPHTATYVLPSTVLTQGDMNVQRAPATVRDSGHPANAATVRPHPVVTTYTVHKGDTLYKIATRTSTNWHTMAQQNHLTHPQTIYPGQVLTL